MFTLPNYPPTKWCLAQKELKPNFAKVVKTIYIGTLSMDYCYIKEYCEWVSKMSGKVLFDVYGYNIEEETHHFLKELNCPFVRYFSGGIEYDDIPKLLSSYDVGVILYKALTENFKFNAPNKLFEYMACGLEVWYSEKILGIKPYNKNTYPRILSVKFTNIPTTILLDTKKLDTEPHQPFFAETVYKPYLKKIIP
jgi:glycosyltransferase involved in cell wall biosynthesis